MAAKKKRVAAKRVAVAKRSKAKTATIYGVERDFLIITGGGLLVIVLTVLLLLG
jgi:hypothetical protein